MILSEYSCMQAHSLFRKRILALMLHGSFTSDTLSTCPDGCPAGCPLPAGFPGKGFGHLPGQVDRKFIYKIKIQNNHQTPPADARITRVREFPVHLSSQSEAALSFQRVWRWTASGTGHRTGVRTRRLSTDGKYGQRNPGPPTHKRQKVHPPQLQAKMKKP